MGGQIIFVKIALVKDALTKKDSYSLKKLIKSVISATVHKKVEPVLLPKAKYMDSVFIPGIKACVYTSTLFAWTKKSHLAYFHTIFKAMMICDS